MAINSAKCSRISLPSGLCQKQARSKRGRLRAPWVSRCCQLSSRLGLRGFREEGVWGWWFWRWFAERTQRIGPLFRQAVFINSAWKTGPPKTPLPKFGPVKYRPERPNEVQETHLAPPLCMKYQADSQICCCPSLPRPHAVCPSESRAFAG